MGRHDNEAGTSRRDKKRIPSPSVEPARVVPRRGNNFNLGEASILADYGLLVLVGWNLPVGWKVANDGHAIPPLPVEDADVKVVAAYRRSLMSPEESDDPRYHNVGWWREQLRQEHRQAVERRAYPRLAGLNVDFILASYGYVPDTGRCRHAQDRVTFFGASSRAFEAPMSLPVAVKEEVKEDEEEEAWADLDKALADSAEEERDAC